MEGQAPTPQTTLLILLGASAWPFMPEFQPSEAFANAARRLKTYFLNPRSFGLPAENLLDLFDSEKSADELDVAIGLFLRQRQAAMKATGNAARDLLLYFIGHGGFVGRDADFFLAILRTRMDNPRASGLPVLALADTLTERTRFLRRIIILDCCFAAAAFSAFEAGPDQVALEKTRDAFQVGYKAVGFPTKGTTLLCSSSHKSPSLLLPDGSSTMFTKAFLDALIQGASSPREHLTLRDVKDLAAALLSETRNAPRPVVLSPDQSEGDVADIPFFPNPRTQEERAHQAEADMLDRPEPDHQGISRRTVILGLGLAGLTVAGGGLTWLVSSRKLAPSFFFYPTPMHTSISLGTLIYTYRGHAGLVLAVAWSPDSKRIASGSSDNTVQVWNAADGSHVYIYRGHDDFVYAVKWSPDGNRIASGSSDGTVQIWDATDGERIYTYRGHSGYVLGVACSSDGRRVASGGNDRTVQVWDEANGGHVSILRGHSGSVNAVAWSPDGTRIASGSSDNTVQVWNAADGRHIYTFSGHSEQVHTVAWSPDSKRIASGSYDNTVQVWNAADGRHIYTFSGHTHWVEGVAWSPDGKRIASSSWDDTVQVWDATNGGHLYIYGGHSSPVFAVAWSPDGTLIASGSGFPEKDRTVQVWGAG